MTVAFTRAERPYDPADLSSSEFWASTGKEREKTFAELRGASSDLLAPPGEERTV